MMSYTELQKTFARQVQTAIAEYQALFVRRAMPAHRAADIAAISELFHGTYDIEQLRTELTALLIQFKTGWFIFSTGNSRLRDNILSHLRDPQYSPDAFLKSRILELEQTTRELQQVTPLEHVLTGYESLTQDENIQAVLRQARQALTESRETIQTLSTDNETLRAENAHLEEENQALRQSNHRLSERLQTKRTSEQFACSKPVPIHNNRADGEEEQMDIQTISPGTAISRSFSSIPKAWAQMH